MFYKVGYKVFHSLDNAIEAASFDDPVDQIDRDDYNVISVFWTHDSNELVDFDPPEDCLPIADGNHGAEYLVGPRSRSEFFARVEEIEGLYTDERRNWSALLKDIDDGRQDMDLADFDRRVKEYLSLGPDDDWDWDDIQFQIPVEVAEFMLNQGLS